MLVFMHICTYTCIPARVVLCLYICKSMHPYFASNAVFLNSD